MSSRVEAAPPSPERPAHYNPQARERYMKMPKILGDVSVVELLGVAYDLDDSHFPIESTIRGQALVEAAILDAQRDYQNDDEAADTADEHLEWLGAAEEELGKAVRIHRMNALEEGLFDHLLLYYRTKLYLLFMPLYEDLSCGEVTQESLDEVHESLRKLIQELNRDLRAQMSPWETESLKGVLHEAVLPLCLIKMNKNRLLLPASMRADSGEENGELAHDLTYFKYDPDTARINFDGLRPWQVKGVPESRYRFNDSTSLSHQQQYDTDRVELIYIRQDLSESEWNQLLQDIVSINSRTQRTRTINSFINSIHNQTRKDTPEPTQDGLSASAADLEKLTDVFARKK